MNSRGFTLIELLVVIAIMGILLAVGTGVSIRAIRTAELREAANDLAADLRRARSIAQRESTDVSVVLPNGTAAPTYSVQGQSRTLPAGANVACTSNCGTQGTTTTTYRAPYGALGATGQVYTVSSPHPGIAPFEVRLVGVTGKVIVVRATP